MFWKNQAFKDQQNYWYQKIADEGFKDIEGDDHLKQRATNVYRQATRMERYAKREYYLLLAQYLKERAPEFDDGIDYFVIYKFSIGYSNIQIVRSLQELGEPRHRKTIMFIRRKYEDRWGIRKWLPHQMKSMRHMKQD